MYHEVMTKNYLDSLISISNPPLLIPTFPQHFSPPTTSFLTRFIKSTRILIIQGHHIVTLPPCHILFNTLTFPYMLYLVHVHPETHYGSFFYLHDCTYTKGKIIRIPLNWKYDSYFKFERKSETGWMGK